MATEEERSVYSQLREIRDAVGQLDRSYVAQVEACKAHFQRTTNVELALFGNGTEGLKTSTVRLQEAVDRAVKDIEGGKKRELMLWANIIAAVSAVCALIGVLVVLFR